MGEHDRCGHELGGLIAGVAKHDTLITRALLRRLLARDFPRINALGDILGLGGEIIIDEHRVSMEHVVIIHIANLPDSITNDFAHIDNLFDGLGATSLLVLQLGNRDLAAHDHDIGFHECLARHSAGAVNGQACVKHAVRNQVGDLVRVAFTNRLGGKHKGICHKWKRSMQEGIVAGKRNINACLFIDACSETTFL